MAYIPLSQARSKLGLGSTTVDSSNGYVPLDQARTKLLDANKAKPAVKPTAKPTVAPTTKPKAPISKPTTKPNLIQQAQNLIDPVVTKVTKEPIVGQSLQVAKDLTKQAVSIIKAAPTETKKAATHPIESASGFAFGAGKAITDAAVSTKKAITNVQNGIDTVVYNAVGYKPPKNWDPRQNRDVIVKSLESFQKRQDEQLANLGEDTKRGVAVGNFIGSFVPYAVAGELSTAAVGTTLAIPAVTKFIPQAVKFAPTIGNAIGFLGLDQITYDKGEGTRVDKLKNDLIMLGLFEAGGVLAKGLNKVTKGVVSKVVNKASRDIKGKGADLNVLEQQVKDVKTTIKQDTGKSAETILSKNMVSATDSEITGLAKSKVNEDLTNQYIKKNGNVVDSDRAKELIPGYTPEKAPEFHKQSQAVRDQVYSKLLVENKGKGDNTVYFTAGGAASGKSESLVRGSTKGHAIAYDTTLSSPGRVADVKKALESGYNVHIDYTAADPVAAWERAQIRGRAIPPESFARDYAQSLENVKNLYNEYKNSPNATFRFTDNRGAMGQAKAMTFDEINKLDYNKDRILGEIKANESQNSQKQTGTGSTSGQNSQRSNISNEPRNEAKVSSKESITPPLPAKGNPIEKINQEIETLKKDRGGFASGLKIAQLEKQKKVLEEVKISPKEVSVPREQLPVVSKAGIEKASKLEARVTQSLDKTPQEIKDQLGSTYEQMSKPEQIAKATDYVTKNPEEALAVLRGEKEAPKGLLKNSIYVAMENQAVGDVELARKLASLGSTRAGQELSILTEINPDSPVKHIRDVINVREQAFKERFKGKSVSQVIEQEAGKIKAKVKTPDKYDWNNFIKSIQC